MKKLMMILGYAGALGALTAFSDEPSRKVSSPAVTVDGRSWTSSASEGIEFSTRPMKGLVIVIR